VGIALGALLLARTGRADVVERRGAVPEILGDVQMIDENGVRIRPDTGSMIVVPWDRVRDVRTDRPAPRLEAWMLMAEDLWRARSRVQRQDYALAEPLFARHFELSRGQTHETALVVAEGLLRCRLARGAHAAAVIPALEVARLREAGVTTDVFDTLPPVMDDTTRLCTALAPAWGIERTADRMRRDLATYDAQGDRVVAALAALYARAAAWQLGADPDAQPDEKPDEHDNEILIEHPGVALLRSVVACAAPDADVREAARRNLSETAAERPRWAQAWFLLGSGASLLRESGRGRQQRGMVELVRVAVVHGREQPYLAALALRWVGDASAATSDFTTAQIMEAELARRFATHPVRVTDHPLSYPRGDETVPPSEDPT
jgi:hypothetical protein